MCLMFQNKDTNTIYGLGCYCKVLTNEVDDTETWMKVIVEQEE